jgi:hypothetical protein
MMAKTAPQPTQAAELDQAPAAKTDPAAPKPAAAPALSAEAQALIELAEGLAYVIGALKRPGQDITQLLTHAERCRTGAVKLLATVTDQA